MLEPLDTEGHRAALVRDVAATSPREHNLMDGVDSDVEGLLPGRARVMHHRTKSCCIVWRIWRAWKPSVGYSICTFDPSEPTEDRAGCASDDQTGAVTFCLLW
jgi:hypothetical protein